MMEPVETIARFWGFAALWQSGDFKVDGLILLLSILMLAAVFVIQGKMSYQIWLRAGRRAQKPLTTLESITELIQAGDRRGRKSFRSIAEAGLSAASEYRGRTAERVSFHEWVTSSVEHAVRREQSKLQAGLTPLPTIGVVAPAVALYCSVCLLLNSLIAYAQVTVLLPTAEPVATSSHLPSDQQDGVSKDAVTRQDLRNPEAGSTALDPGRVHARDSAAQLANRAHRADIFRMVGQAMWVLLMGAGVTVISFVGYGALRAMGKTLEDTLGDFGRELTVCLLRSPLPPAKGADLADDAASVPAR
jgi:biopolymer transport protein ExbB/TolQ